jgi:hypothetical protein
MGIQMELRLEKRYNHLVRSHMQVGHELAAGVKSLLSEDIGFNQTQAAWRFFKNENCTLEDLSEPLLKASYELSEQECDEYILIPHDWSHLSYGSHRSKRDTYNTFKKSVGYELQSSLIISDRHGGPLSPVVMNLKTKDETISYYEKKLEGLTHLEELTKRIGYLESQGFKKPLVHIVDREGDSIAFLRSIKGRNWLIRANDNNCAEAGTQKKKLKEIGKELTFTQSRRISYKGKAAYQWIAETEVVITRKAQPKRKGVDGKRLPLVGGSPVEVRLIISRVVDSMGKELATWYLLSTMPKVPASTLALWYYWRWSIENYFKLVKSAGMQLESWQQTTGKGIFRRLLVASMACVWVWRISLARGPKAEELRKILVKLSGRQMKWKKEFTCTALCAGLWVLLSMQNILDYYDPEKIKSLFSHVFGEKGFV